MCTRFVMKNEGWGKEKVTREEEWRAKDPSKKMSGNRRGNRERTAKD